MRFRTGERDRFLGGAGLDQHRLAVDVERLADLGHRKVPRRALEQAHAQALLEQGDAPAQLGLRHAQCAPGRREAAVFHHLGEVVEVVQILHGPLPSLFI